MRDPEPSPYFVQPETDGEILPVCDEDDRVVGQATRREIHERNLIHRAIHVVLIDGEGRVCLQKRSAAKDRYPGWWDVSVGGHVGVGERYVDAARREMAEEMGIHSGEPVFVAALSPGAHNGWEHIHLFSCAIDHDVVPDPDEVIDWEWIEPEELFRRAAMMTPSERGWRITPSGLASIERWHGRTR
jgi:isopentenyldiphosphate isomerase